MVIPRGLGGFPATTDFRAACCSGVFSCSPSERVLDTGLLFYCCVELLLVVE
jgi:hypothetical protein